MVSETCLVKYLHHKSKEVNFRHWTLFTKLSNTFFIFMLLMHFPRFMPQPVHISAGWSPAARVLQCSQDHFDTNSISNTKCLLWLFMHYFVLKMVIFVVSRAVSCPLVPWVESANQSETAFLTHWLIRCCIPDLQMVLPFFA